MGLSFLLTESLSMCDNISLILYVYLVVPWALFYAVFVNLS